MHRTTLARHTAVPGILLAIAFAALIPEGPAHSRGWTPPDSLVTRVHRMADEQRYAELLEILPPYIEDALARGDSLRLGRLICARGRAELGTGLMRASERSLIASARMSEAHADTLTWLMSLGVLAFSLNNQARFGESLVVLGHQSEIARAANDTLGLAFSFLSTGYARLNLGHAGEARAAYVKAESLFAAAGVVSYRLTALTGLGRAYTQLGDIDDARRTYRRVERLARDAGDVVNQSDAINNLGTIEYNYGDLELAADYFERAWRLRSSRVLYEGDVLSNIALIRTALGDYDGAAAILEEAREGLDERGALLAYQDITTELANVYFVQGRHRAAARLYREAIRSTDNVLKRGEAGGGLARVLLEADSLDAALTVVRSLDVEGLEAWDRADLTLLESRILLRMHDAASALAVARVAEAASAGSGLHPEACTHLARCLIAAGDTTGARRWLENAVASVEDRRRATGSLTWREVASESDHAAFVDVAAVLFDPATSGEGPSRAFDLLQRVKARTMLERIASPTRSGAPVVEPATLERVEQLLGDHDLLLDFHAGDRHTLLFAVTRRGARLVVLPGQQSGLAVQVGMFRDALGQRSALDSSAPMIEAARRVVGDALLGRISDMVDPARRVIVCPDGYLNMVPFVLLPLPGGDALGDRAVVTRLPVASMLDHAGGAATAAGILAVTGTDPGLTGAAAEVRDLEHRFRHVTVTRGLAPHLADSMAVHAVVHVAAHVDVDDTRPWHSGIRLDASAARSHLRASDILGLDLRGRLAVLAACESGMGRISRGQGVLGLSSAFLVSGMESVVATLWRVDDRATRALMTAFYDELAAGAPVADALSGARKRLRERPDTAHPYYWAGFVLVGPGESSIELERKRTGARPAMLGVGLLAAVVLILVVKNRRSA